MDDTVLCFIDSYRTLGLTGKPLEPERVKALEHELGLPLPAAYRAYLLLAGAYPPASLVGSDCHDHYLLELRANAQRLLIECGAQFQLPENAVVFLMHQGYQFLYCEAGIQLVDPEVWYYREYEPRPKLLFQRFSDWVTSIAAEK
jgi:hypothetical protein